MCGGRHKGMRGEDAATGVTAILAAGSPPSHEVPVRIFREAGRLVACDGAWRTAMGLGRRPDAVVGDGDSLGDDGRESLAQLGIPFVCDREQDTNDLCKAFRFAMAGARGDRIAILGATGRREDHSIGNIFHLMDFAEEMSLAGSGATDGADVAMVTDAGVFEPILPPGRAWDALPNQPVSIFAPMPGTEMASEGLEWGLEGVDMGALWRGTLNQVTDGRFSIHTNHPAIIFLPHLQSGGVFWYISHLSPA